MPMAKNRRPPLYSVWSAMRRRCRNPNDASWPHYGARGITVCPAWDDYRTFEKDMWPRPPGASIERIDVNGNYERSNCRWATAFEQSRNRRCNRFVVIDGNRYRAIDLARINGRKLDTIMKRVARGLTYKQVIQRERINHPKVRDIASQASAAARQKRLAETHCINGHKWTAKNTRILSNTGCRRCLTCLRAAEARAWHKRRTL